MTLPPPRLAAAVLAALALLVPPAAAQDATPADPCVQDGKTIQCNAYGSIAMDSQRGIQGDPITLTVDIHLAGNFADQGARWVLVSVRNATGEGTEPVAVGLVRFATPTGDVVTTRVEQASANELNLWVDILDVPVNTPITLEVQVGSSQRGAYRLEALVLPFDRNYETLRDASGGDVSLFASTLLGVNRETGQITNAGGGSLLEGKKMPAAAFPAVAAALGAAALAARRRRA